VTHTDHKILIQLGAIPVSRLSRLGGEIFQVTQEGVGLIN
jgi:hypothetical protein